LILDFGRDGNSKLKNQDSALRQPTLWFFGGRDLSHPTLLSIHNLNEITSSLQKSWTIHVSQNVNHEVIVGSTICQTIGPAADLHTPRSNITTPGAARFRDSGIPKFRN
jgi:hypothetical protein